MAVLGQSLSILLVLLLAWDPSLCGQTSPALQIHIISGGERPQILGRGQSQDISVRVTDGQNRRIANLPVTFQLPSEGVSGLFADGTVALVVTTDGDGVATASGIQWGGMAGIVPIRVTASQGTAHAGLVIRQELVWPIATPSPTRISIPAVGPPAPGTLPVARNHTTSGSPPPPAVEITTKKSPMPKATDSDTPAVTISNSGTGGPSFNKKWLLLLAVAGAAGGIAVAMMGKKSSTPAANPNTTDSIGAPTISIGH